MRRRHEGMEAVADDRSCPSLMVFGVGESDRTMDILVRRALPPRSWQAEESRTRMSKVLLKRRLPVLSGLILAGFDAILYRSAETPAAGFRGNITPDSRASRFMAKQSPDSLGGQETFTGPLAKPTGPLSLGDQNTFSEKSSDSGDTDFGDDIEIVDLSVG